MTDDWRYYMSVWTKGEQTHTTAASLDTPTGNNTHHYTFSITLHLRMCPPLMIIISLSSTTWDDGGWLETTPSWPEAPPQTALYAPLSSKAFSLTETKRGNDLMTEMWCRPTLYPYWSNSHYTVFAFSWNTGSVLQTVICTSVGVKCLLGTGPVWIQKWCNYDKQMIWAGVNIYSSQASRQQKKAEATDGTKQLFLAKSDIFMKVFLKLLYVPWLHPDGGHFSQKSR